MKVVDLKKLIDEYGDLKISEIIIKKGKFFGCPKCNGEGKTSIEYNAYPSGLPDSGWVKEWQSISVECVVCDGHGYTEKELKPITKTEIIGYE